MRPGLVFASHSKPATRALEVSSNEESAFIYTLLTSQMA